MTGLCRKQLHDLAVYGRTDRLGYVYCKMCKVLNSQNWRANRTENWKTEQRRRNAERAKERGREARQAILDHYGHVCACCGETEEIFLTLDHVNEDGAAHRQSLAPNSPRRSISGKWVYYWIIQNGFPGGFQILCMNCNWAKSRGGCPHAAA